MREVRRLTVRPLKAVVEKFILLAEDSADDALALTRVLRAAGVLNPIREVRSGREAVAYLSREAPFSAPEAHPFPSILFLDLLMPDGDGWQVLRWLKSNPPKSKILIIVLTGTPQSKLLREAYLAGAHTFLLKPFTEGELYSLISNWPDVWKLESRDERGQPALQGQQKY